MIQEFHLRTGQLREPAQVGLHLLAKVTREIGKEIQAHAVAQEGAAAIAGILAGGQIHRPAVGLYLRAPGIDQRPDDGHSLSEHPARRDPGQAVGARAADQVEQHRLHGVIRRVRGGHLAGVHRVGRAQEETIALAAGRMLQAEPALAL